MKRKLLVLMAVLMAAVSPAWADDEITNNVSIEIDAVNHYRMNFNLNHTKKTAEVGNNSYSTVSAVVIPETVEHSSETYRVTSIASNAFSEAKAKTIKIGNNVVSIGGEAFKYCYQLETLIIGTGVKTIGSKILQMGDYGSYCDKTIIALPTTVPTLDGVLCDSHYYAKIVSIKVPKGSLDSYKIATTWIQYSGKMSEIDPTVVLDYKNFDTTNKTVKVAFSVTADRSQSLGSVDIPASVEKDGMTYNVTAVAEGGFANCTGITAIKLPPTITDIGANAFSGCTTLTKLYLTSTDVPTIGTDALVSGLKIMVTEAGYDKIYTALGSTYTVDQLKEISYKTLSGKPLAVGTGNLTGATDCYVYYSGELGAIVYEGEITEIVYNTFKGNTDLQEIIFTASVGAFQNGCFQNCTTLTTAVLPEGISALPINTFNGCTSLTSVKLPEGITKINSGAFENCTSLKTLVVPEKVTSISYDAFAQCTSSGFNLIMLPSSAPAIDFRGISNADNKFKGFTPYKVSVHNNAHSSYYNDAFWKQYTIHRFTCIKYKTSNQAIGTLDKDADFGTPVLAHYYNSDDKYCYLEFAEEPKIGANAFKGFDQLDCLIDMPTGLTSIGASAFEGCTNLRHFQVPTTVTEIGADAFKGCTGLNDLTYSGTLADWCKITFANAAANPMNGMAAGTGTINNGSPIFDAALTIPSGIETLKAYTFVNSYITSLNLGEVTAIGNGSFQNCSALATINVSTDEPATLGENAFESINENHAVYVPLNSYLTYKADEEGWGTLNLTPLSDTIELTDAKDYKIDKDVAGCQISYTRNVTTENWMGIYLPFDVTVGEGGTYATLTGVSEGVLDWTTVATGGTIPACTPFIYKPTDFEAGEETRDIVFSASAAQLHSCTESNPATADGYTLYGNFTEITTMKTIGAYSLANNAFKQADSDAKHLKPYRVYIKANAPALAPATLRNRINDVDATAIEGVEYVPISVGTACNLQGIEVGDGYKGIVIVNGRKVLRK